MVPGDPSSAAFFTALTILNENSKLKLKNVGLNPTRIGFYELLKKHGAKIKFKNIKNKIMKYTEIFMFKVQKLNQLKLQKIFMLKQQTSIQFFRHCCAYQRNIYI